MFDLFCPWLYEKDVYSIKYEELYSQGFRGIVFDIDKTLVYQGEDATEEVIQLIDNIKQIGFKIVLVSNNQYKRVSTFANKLQVPYINSAEKPSKRGFLNALEIMELKKEQVFCVGDQIFTDVWGANRCGVNCILVKYLKKQHVLGLFSIKRCLEKMLICYFKSKNLI